MNEKELFEKIHEFILQTIDSILNAEPSREKQIQETLDRLENSGEKTTDIMTVGLMLFAMRMHEFKETSLAHFVKTQGPMQ